MSIAIELLYRGASIIRNTPCMRCRQLSNRECGGSGSPPNFQTSRESGSHRDRRVSFFVVSASDLRLCLPETAESSFSI